MMKNGKEVSQEIGNVTERKTGPIEKNDEYQKQEKRHTNCLKEEKIKMHKWNSYMPIDF